MKTIKVNENQSLLDFAIQTAGDASTAFMLALANDISITDELETGQELIPAGIMVKDITDYYTNRKLKPATWPTDDSLPGRIFDYTFDNSFN